MANALKCDRCGCCFDPKSGNAEHMSFDNPIYRNAASNRDHARTRFYNQDDINARIDLCPSCTVAFERFMRCDSEEQTELLQKDQFIEHLSEDFHNMEVKYKAEIEGYQKEINELLDKRKYDFASPFGVKGKYDTPYSFFFDKQSDAEDFREQLKKFLAEYGSVTFADVLYMVKGPGSAYTDYHHYGWNDPRSEYTDYRYGWKDLHGSFIVPTEPDADGHQRWRVRLPKPIPLYENYTESAESDYDYETYLNNTKGGDTDGDKELD